MSYLKSRLPEFSPAVVEMPKVCTLEHLIMWLKTKPADEVYCWERTGQCLFSQYGMEMGLSACASAYLGAVDGFAAIYGTGGCEPFSIAVREPHTFGAALSRARAALESQP